MLLNIYRALVRVAVRWRPCWLIWPLLVYSAGALAQGLEPGPQDSLGQPVPEDSSYAQAADSFGSASKKKPDSLKMEPTLPGDDGSPQAVRYQADGIDYLVDRELIILTGRARVSYRDIRVEGDSIAFDTRRQILSVSQNPVLYDKEDAIYGQRMVYDFRRRRGWVDNGFTKFEKGRYWGRRVRLVGERTLNVDYGRYTTCEAENPHYYFWARRMKIYVDDKLVAQPVVLCFSGIPVLMVPFWILPLRHDRHSGFLMPRFGSSSYEGVYVKNIAYYQVINDLSDLTVSGDYFEFIGWRGNLEGRYISGNRLSATGLFSYLEDRKQLQRRWSLNADYSQRLGRRTTAVGHADLISDQRYRRDFSDNLGLRLERNLRSYLALNHSWTTGGLAAAMDHTYNLDLETKSSRLPEVSANLYRLDLPGRIAGLSGASYFINSRNVQSGRLEQHQGWDNSTDISSTVPIFKYLSLQPRAVFRLTWYDRDTSGQRNVWRRLYQWGLAANTTLYGLLPLRLGPLLGLRHVVQPSLSYAYAPKIEQGRFYSFGSIGQMGQQKYLGLALGQVFQAKLRQGDVARKVDILTVNSSASYNYLAWEKPWSGINSSATLLPGNRLLDLRLNNYYNVYARRSESTNLDVSLRLSGDFQKKSRKPEAGAGKDTVPGAAPDTLKSQSSGKKIGKDLSADSTGTADSAGIGHQAPAKPQAKLESGLPWSAWLGLSQGWRSGQGMVQSMLRGSVEANLTKNWKLSYGQYYDLRKRQLVSQEYSIYRDLHCWEARFSSTKSGLYWSYEIRINLKAIPEIKLQMPKSGQVAY